MARDRLNGSMRVTTALLLAVCGSAFCIAGYAAPNQRAQNPVLIPIMPPPSLACAARANAVIANAGRVVVIGHSLIDSYQSAHGAYGGNNAGDNGRVQAAKAVLRFGGIIRGPIVPNSPAGLAAVPVPQNAKPLPLGAAAPGSLKIHDKHDSITLQPGTYVAANIDVDFPGAINVFPAGVVSIFVTGRLNLDGEENVSGSPANMQFIVTGKDDVRIGRHGTLVGLLYAPRADVSLRSKIFGSVVGANVELAPHAAVHFDESSICHPTSPTTPAVPPKPLPAPPSAAGCYVNTRNGWQSVPCTGNAEYDSHFPRPDAQITVTSTAASPLVYGQLAVTLPQVGTENNAFLASTGGITGCQSSGSPVPNQWSVQSNTNKWTVSSGASAGHTAATQFVIQANGINNGICVWNVDVTAQDYSHRTCSMVSPPQRPGGLQAFDSGNLAATILPNGNIGLVAELTWVPSGQPNQYAFVSLDTYGLASHWSEVSGGILGMGSCSQAQFTNTEVVTQIAASICPGDTQQDSPVCAPPTLQPNASVTVGGTGTVETSNLTATAPPSLSYPNTGLVVTNQTATTSGSCLGPSHAYVKDSPQDFGATPSTIGNQVFWESPDIFLVPHGTPVDLNAVSTETAITPGGQFDIWVRVHNDLGCSDVTGVKTLVYLADPSALSVQWTTITNMQYVGDNMSSTGVTAPAGGQALIGPLTFTAPTTGFGNGHKCILAAIEADGEPAPANSADAPDSNQVAQRNIQFVGTCEYPFTNATTTDGNVLVTLTATPNTGPAPSLTTLPDVEVSFDDADSSWFNVWNAQPESGTAFAVTHNAAANSTTVRLGESTVGLYLVPLAAGQTRNATSSINLASGSLTLQLAATLVDSGGHMLVTNGGSCTAMAPIIR